MKKLILILMITVCANYAQAQLDSMMIRPAITLQAQDWAWLRGKLGATRDSAILRSDRNINAQIKTIQGLQWTTNVTIDSLPGKLVFAFYQVLRKDAGEQVARYNAILSALQGATQLTVLYNNYDAAIARDKDAAITIGKYIYLDQ